MRYVFLSIVIFLAGCEKSNTDTISISLNDQPEIDFSMLGEYSVEINNSGQVEWSVWIENCPPEDRIVYQFTNKEYQTALQLTKNVFENDYDAEKIYSHEDDPQIYIIKLGQYWTSVDINIVVKKSEEAPNNLNSLISFIDTLKNDEKIPTGKPNQRCMDERKKRAI